MDPQSAQQTYLMARDYNNAILWLFLAFFVFAPLLLVFSWTIILFLLRKKCPKCGDKKHNLNALRIVEEGNVTTQKHILVCGVCGSDIT
jgi:hypothetical protein